MAIDVARAQFFPSFNPASQVGIGFGSPVGGFSAAPGGLNSMGSLGSIMNLLTQVLGALTQLSQAWGGFVGGAQPGLGQPGGFAQPGLGGFGQPGGFAQPGVGGFGQPGGFAQPGLGGFGQPGGFAQPGFGGFGQPGGFAQPGFGQPFGGGSQFPSVAFGGFQPGFGGVPTGLGVQTGFGTGFSAPSPSGPLPYPSDPQEFASYLQAQRIGGTLEGKTGIAQKDAIGGTRFGRVQDSTMWQASVARNYAYQFAAYASGNDALTPEGVAAGARAFGQMNQDAQLFMQVASVFKGNLFNGPGFYDNPGLKQLLLSKGLTDLAGKPGVGETDVQSIGAIASAINSGRLTLNEVLQSGTIDNIGRYTQIIGYVQQGGFANDLVRYDTVPV